SITTRQFLHAGLRQLHALSCLGSRDEAGAFEARHIVRDRVRPLRQEGFGWRARGVVAQGGCQCLQECGFPVGSFAVKDEEDAFPCICSQGVAGGSLYVFDQSDVLVEDLVEEGLPAGAVGGWIPPDWCQTRDEVRPTVRARLACTKIERPIRNVQQPGVSVESRR